MIYLIIKSNYEGELGLGNITNVNFLTKNPISYYIGKIDKISCGFHHSILINDMKEIYICGSN